MVIVALYIWINVFTCLTLSYLIEPTFMKNTLKQLILVFFAAFYSGQLLADPGKNELTHKPAPLSFIENKGQVTDQSHNSRHDIQFIIKAAPGLTVFIGCGSIHYQFSKSDNLSAGKQDSKNSGAKFETAGPVAFTMDRMDVELIGSNKNAKVVSEGKLEYSESYFNDIAGNNDNKADAYNKLTYKDIYPGIDWVLYIKNGVLEHEFVIRQGGKVSDIQLKYDGASDLKIYDDGSLIAITPQGVITEKAPETYQKDGKKVSSGFELNDNVVSYTTGGYNGEIVIDPTLCWATYYGGTSIDQGNSVATDGNGNVYIAGSTSSATAIATTGAYHVVLSGATDAFLAKLNSNGAMQWSTYYGGSDIDEAFGVATDAAGDIYITGYTGSTSGIATAGAHQVTYGGGTYDVFLAKFRASGLLLWSTYYGGSDRDIATGVATDVAGNVYITGTTASVSGIATAGSHQPVLAGGSVGDAFLAKFSTSGALQWATYFGGPDNDNGMGVATDAFGAVCLTGITYSTTGIATITAIQPSLGGFDDAFVARFNASSGHLFWATYYGGTEEDDGYAVAADAAGNIYMTGWTSSTSAIATPGAYQTTIGGGGADALLAKFDSLGYLSWATYYGGSSQDYGYGLTTIGTGNVYMTGRTSSSTGIATSDAVQPSPGGGDDAYLANFSGAGSLLWATYYGGSAIDYGTGIANDDSGNIYISGYTSSTSAISAYGAYQEYFAGGSFDAFLAKYNFFCVVLPVVPPITGTPFVCPGDTLMVGDSTIGGVWTTSTSHTSVTGWIITGVSAGLDTVYYTVTNTCGPASVSMPVTINPLPYAGAITGIDTVCAGSTVTLTDLVPGGIWGSYNPHATVSGGITTGVSAGRDTITYSVSNSCGTAVATMPVTVNTTPVVGIISGSAETVCPGSVRYFSDGTPGGIWSTSNPDATISGGMVTGVSTGTDSVIYTVTNACGSTAASIVVTIDPAPVVGAITGPSFVCTGDSVTLSDTTTGGYWSGSSSAITIYGSIVGGVSAGISVVTYSVYNTVCGELYVYKTIIVPGLPVVAAITGPDTICQGDSVILLNDTLGGKWTSSPATIAKADSLTGAIKGIAAGTATVTYTLTNLCGVVASTTFTVNVLAHKYCNTLVPVTPPESGETLSVLPNPNNGSFSLNLIAAVNEPVQVTITNVIGQKVKEFTTSTNKVTDVQLSDAAGVYLLNATTSTGRHVAKVIIN